MWYVSRSFSFDPVLVVFFLGFAVNFLLFILFDAAPFQVRLGRVYFVTIAQGFLLFLGITLVFLSSAAAGSSIETVISIYNISYKFNSLEFVADRLLTILFFALKNIVFWLASPNRASLLTAPFYFMAHKTGVVGDVALESHVITIPLSDIFLAKQ